ncbi:MAG: GAF domain-containing protein [Anaerolineales bacterium]
MTLSGETLLIHGKPLEKFKVAALGRSAAVVPIKVKTEVIGLLIVLRKQERPFDHVEQTLLEAMAGFASVSLVNARLFRASSRQPKEPSQVKSDRIPCWNPCELPCGKNCKPRRTRSSYC